MTLQIKVLKVLVLCVLLGQNNLYSEIMYMFKGMAYVLTIYIIQCVTV